MLVAGGGSVRSSYGQFSAILGPDVNGNIHDIECQAVDQITGTFPTFRLDDVITEAKATVGSHHVFPQEIGGAPVKLLIGIRSTQLAPVHVTKRTLRLRFKVPQRVRSDAVLRRSTRGVYPCLPSGGVSSDVRDAAGAVYGVGCRLHGRHSSCRRTLHLGRGGRRAPQCPRQRSTHCCTAACTHQPCRRQSSCSS